MIKIKCNFCRSSGSDPEEPWRPCRKCKGKREILVAEAKTDICGFCRGTGRDKERPWDLCRVCNGDIFVEGLTPSPKGIRSMMVIAGRPYDAQKEIELILDEITGDISVCDPYLGDSSLDRLELLKNIDTARFLTQRNQSNPTKFNTFKSQYTNFKFSKLNHVLHDRYIISSDSIIFLGHGLKDIGKKDSFIISLDSSIAEDLIVSTQNAFNSHWERATIL